MRNRCEASCRTACAETSPGRPQTIRIASSPASIFDTRLLREAVGSTFVMDGQSSISFPVVSEAPAVGNPPCSTIALTHAAHHLPRRYGRLLCLGRRAFRPVFEGQAGRGGRTTG